jgi:hypothetical protein
MRERSRRRGGRWEAGTGGEEDAGQQETGEAPGRRRAAARTAVRVAAQATMNPSASPWCRLGLFLERFFFSFFRWKKVGFPRDRNRPALELVRGGIAL